MNRNSVKRVVLLLWLLASPVFASGIEGSYLLVRDSDGTTPKKNATVSISFKPGAQGEVSMHAVQPGETVSDKGRYSVSGNVITVRFAEMEWEAKRQEFRFDGCTLVLPFKALAGSPGPGTSTWRKQTPDCAKRAAEVLAPGSVTTMEGKTGPAQAEGGVPASQKQAAPKILPKSSKPPCDCTYAPCIKAMIEQKRKLKDIYERLARKYEIFYFVTDANGKRIPVDTIENSVLGKTTTERIDGMRDLLARISAFQRSAEEETAAAPTLTACGIDPTAKLEMWTHPINCETSAAPAVEAALPCSDLWASAVQHEAFHAAECEKRKTAGKDHGQIFLTPYGMAREEAAAYDGEIARLTALLDKVKHCSFSCRCTGQKYSSSAECQRNCKISLRCPVSAANSCMRPDSPDGKASPILPGRGTVPPPR